ncbi:hypothetical protein PENSPDRAFT_423496 [Peniophora sp. CONT]|nr:hypothetical protein PENSPDRAFT_423496 [Peniophora sp. CONT]
MHSSIPRPLVSRPTSPPPHRLSPTPSLIPNAPCPSVVDTRPLLVTPPSPTPSPSPSPSPRSASRPVRPSPRHSDSVFHSDACSMRPQYRALVIGLTYEWTATKDLWPLKGCRNDAHSFAELLRTRYGWQDITVMTDEEKNRKSSLWPTKKNMLEKMTELVADAHAGDMFVIYYAGHSGQVPSVNDTHETDGLDEHMISVDGKKILDDNLREILVKSLPNGTRLTAVFDSCHLWTMLDLRIYPTQSRESDRGQGRTVSEYNPEDKPRSNSLPTPIPIILASLRKKNTRNRLWLVVSALIRLHAFTRSKPGSATGRQARRNVPAITINGVAPADDKNITPIALNDGVAISDTASSILTDTHSALSSEPSAQGDVELRSDPTPRIRVCGHCRMLSIMTPIVNSISARVDGQLAAEDSRKETGIMTPALVHLLHQKPGLSSVEIRRRLNRKVLSAFYAFISTRLKKAGAKKKTEWQVFQLGPEDSEDQHMREPLLLCAPSATRK